MNCQDVQKILAAHQYKIQAVPLPEEVMAHLSACASCRSLVGDLPHAKLDVQHLEALQSTQPGSPAKKPARNVQVDPVQNRSSFKRLLAHSIVVVIFIMATIFTLGVFNHDFQWNSLQHEFRRILHHPVRLEKNKQALTMSALARQKQASAGTTRVLLRANSMELFSGGRLRTRGGTTENATQLQEAGLANLPSQEPSPAGGTEVQQSEQLFASKGVELTPIEADTNGAPEFEAALPNPSNFANSSALHLPSPKFVQALHEAQSVKYIAQKIQIWQNFLKTARDSTYRDLAIYQLARALTAAADSSNDLFQLANAVDCFKKNASVLILLMGKSAFEATFGDLQRRLYAARINR